MPLRLNLIRIVRVAESRNLPLHTLLVGFSAILLDDGHDYPYK